MGRRSGHHSEAEPDIISPQASRIDRGGRSRLGSQSNGAALGGPGPHPRRPDHAGGVRHGDGLHGIDHNEEVNSRRGHRGHPGRQANRGEGIRAPLDGHNSAQGPPHDFFGEDDILEATGNPRGPPQPRGGRQDLFGRHDRSGDDSTQPDQHDNHHGGDARAPLGTHRNQPRGGRSDIPREHHTFRGHNGRANQHEDIGDLPLPGLTERQPFGAAGAHHPSSQRHGHVSQGRESLRHNERHGGSRRGAGNRARSLSVDAYDEPDAGPSSALLQHGGAKLDKGPKEKEGRFVPFTFRTLPTDHAEFLANIFKVRLSKIKEWCDEGLIRMDKKLAHTNVDPLLRRLPSKDRERYEKKMEKMKNEREIEKKFGFTPHHVPTAYERGFYAGQSSALYERGGGGYGRGWPR